MAGARVWLTVYETVGPDPHGLPRGALTIQPEPERSSGERRGKEHPRKQRLTGARFPCDAPGLSDRPTDGEGRGHGGQPQHQLGLVSLCPLLTPSLW